MTSEFVIRTVNIRQDQDKRLRELAAIEQLRADKYVSMSDVVREVLDLGLSAYSRRPIQESNNANAAE